MRKRNILIVVGALAVTALATVGVRAATGFTAPSTLGYSGTLLSGSTPAADGTYILTFTLFGAATGGTALWTETQTSVPVTAGRFSVVLGATTAIPKTALDSTTLWLEITVGSEVLSPRQQVTSVPYAMRAPLQCRTVTASPGGTSATAYVTATAVCDSTETIMGGGCLQGTAWTPYGNSFAGDTSYSCTWMATVSSTSPSQAGQAQARCCKM